MLIRFDKESEYHFTTFSTYNDNHVLITPGIPDIVLSHLNAIREEHNLKIYGFVIMPNYFHVVWYIPQTPGVSKILNLFKGRTSKDCHSELKTKDDFELRRFTRPDGRFSFWQKRFYDYNLTSEDKFREKINYVHANPVRWGLVSNPEEWPYSSYRSLNDLPGALFEVDRL